MKFAFVETSIKTAPLSLEPDLPSDYSGDDY
jgi:hypothetical protein